MSITTETRRSSYAAKSASDKDLVFSVVGFQLAWRADQVAKLCEINLNSARSRLTELAKEGKVVAFRKDVSPISGRTVAVWRAI